MRAVAASTRRSRAWMSPLTEPSSTTVGTCTSPSIEPVSLTESVASGDPPERTLPATWPSRCRPPSKSTSPATRAALPIRVSMRGCRSSRRNMEGSLGRGLDGPGEGLRQRRHVLMARLHLDDDLFGLHGQGHRQLLVEILQVAKVVAQLLHLAAGEGGEL